jgi:hypothetical protein
MSNPFDIRPPVSPNWLEPQPLPPPAEPPRRGGNHILLGLLLLGGGTLLLFCIGAAGGMWLVLSGPYFEPEELWHQQLVYVIDTSVLPEDEKKDIMRHVKRLAVACDSDEMDYYELESVLMHLESSPVFMLLDVGWIDQAIVHAPVLPAAEQAAAARTLQRVARGVQAGKITSGEFYAALPKGYAQPTQLAIGLSDERLEAYYEQLEAEEFQEAGTGDIRASLARLKSLADGAGIPDEVWTFDISDQFGQAVDQALASVAAP